MARILIVSSAHLSRNPRVVKEATSLAQVGHEVEVLTISNYPPAEELDRALLAQAPFRRTTIDFLRPGPVARSASLVRRLHTRLAREAVRLLHHESPWSLGPAGPLLRQALARPADLTIVHNELPAWIGVRLLWAGRRVAADLEDWYSEDLLPSDRRSRPLRLLRLVEGTLLRQAAYTSVPSAVLAAALAEQYWAPIPLVLTNAAWLQPAPLRSPAGPHGPRLVWFSQTIGPGRGLEEFLGIWSRTLPPSRITLVGGAHPAYRDQLLAAVPPPLRSRVFFQELVPPDQLPALLAQHDVGLALEPATPRNKDLAVSNKILQYLNAGLAVLATATAGQREVLAEAAGAGEFIDLHSPATAHELLDGLLADDARLQAMQRAARVAAARRFCWECEAPKLVAAVAAALTAIPRPL